MMFTRVVPLLVAVAVAFAPVALEACQTTCLSHAHVRTVAPQHAHHHHAVGDTGAPSALPASGHDHHHAARPALVETPTPMAAGPQRCDHGTSLPVLSGPPQIVLAVPDVPVVRIDIPQPASSAVGVHDTGTSPSAVRIAFSIQLRV